MWEHLRDYKNSKIIYRTYQSKNTYHKKSTNKSKALTENPKKLIDH